MTAKHDSRVSNHTATRHAQQHSTGDDARWRTTRTPASGGPHSTKSLERHRSARSVAQLRARSLEQPGVEQSLDLLGWGLRMSPPQVGCHHLDPELEHLERGDQPIPQDRSVFGELGAGQEVGRMLILRVSAGCQIPQRSCSPSRAVLHGPKRRAMSVNDRRSSAERPCSPGACGSTPSSERTSASASLGVSRSPARTAA